MAQLKEKCDKAHRELTEKAEELASAKTELSVYQKDVSIFKTEILQLKSDITKLQNEKKDAEDKLKTEKKESSYWEQKASEFDTDLQVLTNRLLNNSKIMFLCVFCTKHIVACVHQAERKKFERMRNNHDKDIKNKEAELAALKGKLKVLEQTAGAGAKRLTELKQEHEDAIKSM